MKNIWVYMFNLYLPWHVCHQGIACHFAPSLSFCISRALSFFLDSEGAEEVIPRIYRWRLDRETNWVKSATFVQARDEPNCRISE